MTTAGTGYFVRIIHRFHASKCLWSGLAGIFNGNSIEKNPKIWLGIDLLATYVNLRPGDLLKIKEKDIDLEHGVITIHNPTKAKNKIKTVRLLPEHVKGIQELKDQFPALPELKFFRHHGGVRLRPQVF